MPTAQSSATASSDLDLLKGTLDVMILKALSWGAMHGFGVARWIRSTTDDVLQIDDSAARAQALREFGDLDDTRRRLRTMDEQHEALARRLHLAADLSRDVRFAVRALARSPGLVAVVGVTLALGIGITSAVYSLVD